MLAADCLEEISSGLDWQFAICASVRDESKKLREPATGEMVPIDITPLIDSGVLEVLELENEAESMRYVEQVLYVDDGEAMSIAIAVSRGLDLAIDDRQATNHILRQFPQVKIWTTPGILHHWATAANVSGSRMAEVILRIESRARYFPARSHELAPWWSRIKEGPSDPAS